MQIKSRIWRGPDPESTWAVLHDRSRLARGGIAVFGRHLVPATTVLRLRAGGNTSRGVNSNSAISDWIFANGAGNGVRRAALMRCSSASRS